MLKESDLDKPSHDLNLLIETLQDIGFNHLLGADPSDADEVLKLEKALAKVLRALNKAKFELVSTKKLCAP